MGSTSAKITFGRRDDHLQFRRQRGIYKMKTHKAVDRRGKCQTNKQTNRLGTIRAETDTNSTSMVNALYDVAANARLVNRERIGKLSVAHPLAALFSCPCGHAPARSMPRLPRARER